MNESNLRKELQGKIQWEEMVFRLTIPANTNSMLQIGDSKQFENPYQLEQIKIITELNNLVLVRLDIDGKIYPNPYLVNQSQNYIYSDALGYQGNALLKPDTQEFTVSSGDSETVYNGTAQAIDYIDVLVDTSSSDYDITVEASVDGSNWIQVASDTTNSGNNSFRYDTSFGNRVRVNIDEQGGSNDLNVKTVFTPAIFESAMDSVYPFKVGTEKGWTLKLFGVNNSDVDQWCDVYLQGWKVPVCNPCYDERG